MALSGRARTGKNAAGGDPSTGHRRAQGVRVLPELWVEQDVGGAPSTCPCLNDPS